MKLSKYETATGKCTECPNKIDIYTCGLYPNCDAEVYLDPSKTYIIHEGKVYEVPGSYDVAALIKSSLYRLLEAQHE